MSEYVLSGEDAYGYFSLRDQETWTKEVLKDDKVFSVPVEAVPGFLNIVEQAGNDANN